MENKDIDFIERQILLALDQYRVRGRTGRKNEWLSDIAASDVKEIAIKIIKNAGVRYSLASDT